MTVLLENYRGLVLQEAWKVWSRLPKQTRAWIGLEDVVETGMAFAWATYDGQYGKHRQWSEAARGSFGTYLKGHLFYHFMNQFVDPYQTALSRRDNKTESIDALKQAAYERGMREFAIEALMADPPMHEDVAECVLVDGLHNIYKQGTSLLKRHFVNWFIRPGETKLHVSGRPFHQARTEFHSLATKHDITIDDCRHVMRSPVCLDQLSRRIFWIPYDLDNPVPTQPVVRPVDRQPWYRPHDPKFRPPGLR